MNKRKLTEASEAEFVKGRKLFLTLMPLPENCSKAMRRGFETEAAKIRNTTISDHIETVAEKIGL